MNKAVYNIYIFDAHLLLYFVTIVLLCLNFVNSRLNNFVDVKSCLNIVFENHISILYLNFARLPNFAPTVKSFRLYLNPLNCIKGSDEMKLI